MSNEPEFAIEPQLNRKGTLVPFSALPELDVSTQTAAKKSCAALEQWWTDLPIEQRDPLRAQYERGRLAIENAGFPAAGDTVRKIANEAIAALRASVG